MLLAQTQISQRTFNYSWAQPHQSIDIPSDVILDISITCPVKCTIGISYISVSAGEFICTLVYGESGEAVTKLLAFVRTTTTGVPIALSCVPGFSGSLLLGNLQNDFDKLFTDPIIVSPMCVATLSNSQYTSTLKLVIGAREVDISGIYSVSCDDNLKLYVGADNTLIIALSDRLRAQLASPVGQADPGIYYLKSINNVYGQHLAIDIDIPIYQADSGRDVFTINCTDKAFKSANLVSNALNASNYAGNSTARPLSGIAIDEESGDPNLSGLPQTEPPSAAIAVLTTYDELTE